MTVILNLVFLGLFLGQVSGYYFCPSGTTPSTLDNSTCYQFVATSANFQNAEIQCNNYGGHLVSIQSGFENSFIIQNAGLHFPQISDFWIGANRMTNVPFSGVCHPWIWPTDQVVRFADWAPGEPNAGINDCVSAKISGGLWYTADCNTTKPYVCGIPKKLLYCPSGWTFFENTQFCYKTFFQAEWEEAEQRCAAENAHLASIHSLEENDFVAGMAHVGMTTEWRGGAWIGLSTVKNNPNAWNWTDGTANDYIHWADGEPREDGDCATLYPDDINSSGNYNLHWDDNDCNEKLRAFVCKRKAFLG
ncbi:hypothetical protein FO519_003884 [Halicephalobus sp. NKZ332]|nr:hypothetical protein FO519_003884 [Halicephalobus sp. NKZ332]